MKIRDFSFKLPPEQIAQHPPKERGTARLMVLNPSSGEVQHKNMQDFPDLIEPGTLVVFNNSRVRKARVFAQSGHGGQVEVFFLNPLGPDSWLCLVSRAKKQRVGKILNFPGGMKGQIISEEGTNRRIFQFTQNLDDAWLEKYGHIPLPPYIKRKDEPEDAERYQSVFSRETGSSAAPTASLHFTPEILQRLEDRGIETAFITLHVGLGTFEPVRTENLLDHKMHREDFYISPECAEKVERAVREGRPVMAVGTTSLRTLESAWQKGEGRLKQGHDSTDIFIYPGYNFKVVNRLFTNFHTPESTLLVLVSAFAGKEKIDRAYHEAVEAGYMFFSYGDAMVIQ